MIILLRRAPLVRLFLGAAFALGTGAYVSGAVAGDICRAYTSGNVGASLERGRPLLCE